MNNAITGTMLATVVAGLLGCAGSVPEAQEPSGHTTASVKCLGINECRGHGECASNGHPCGKHTPCKGQGYLSVASADVCSARGGKVL